MFLKSRSQLNTSGKRLRCTGLRSVRTVRFARQQIAKFLPWFGNGLLLPSSLHSKLCLRSTGSGAPYTRTTGASFRSKEWAFGPFLASLLGSLLALILLISCCFVKQDMARSLRSLALAVSSNMPVPIDWRRYNIAYNRRAAHSVALAQKMTLAQALWTWVWCVVFTYPPVKDDFTIPIFIIMFNIWPFGVIFGCYGTLSDDSDSTQVRFLRHPQQEGQRGRCPAKHTKS